MSELSKEGLGVFLACSWRMMLWGRGTWSRSMRRAFSCFDHAYYGLGWACEVDRNSWDGALCCQGAMLGDSLAMTGRCEVRIMGKMQGSTRKISRHLALRNDKKGARGGGGLREGIE